MAEETEIQVKEETHDFEDEERGEISNEAFESGDVVSSFLARAANDFLLVF
jgi:hypothetical protein